ncbi:MAG: hypothetical protein MUO54_11055, partial [Anaerolineales bacterium]|nr:hypothetical protein [Anaerolineales bacterium]
DFSPNDDSLGTNSFIPRLWATRKIGYLLNQIRYQGENEEWVDAVIQLSLRYGIITPYTSFLIEEDDIFTAEGWDEAAHDMMEEYAGPAVGAEAVEKADAESNLRAAESVPQITPPQGDFSGDFYQPVLKYVEDKTFILQDGIWIDTMYDPASMEPVQIGFNSAVYYELLVTRPSFGKYLALGESVIFVVDGTAYEVQPGEGGVSSLPSQLTNPEKSSASSESGGLADIPAIRSLCSAPWLVGLAVFGFWERNRI